MKRPLKIKRNQRGFSLIEAIVAVAILGTAGVAFLMGLGTGMRVSQGLSQKRAAWDTAQSQMECVKAQDFDNSDTGVDGDGIGVYQTLDPEDISGGLTQSDIVLCQATKIDGSAITATDTVQLITVIVKYEGGKKSVSLSEYKGSD